MATNYCEPSDVIARLSEVAAELRTDDIPIADVTVSVGDCIEEASAEIDAMLTGRYPTAQLALNRWVKFCCRSIACSFLCIRRSQDVPGSIAADCERYREQLKLFASGAVKLPGVPSIPGGPSVSNQSYDNNRYPALRTERPRSTPRDRLPTRRIDPNADSLTGFGGG
jgi:phage gp36-like protein